MAVMTELLFGTAGSGKTTKIFDRLALDAKNNKTAYLIVPEQQALSAEKALLSKLPPSAQLNIEVLNFSRLANKVFRLYGGLSYNYATNSSKMLIMWKNLMELFPMLEEYSGIKISSQNAFSENMLAAINEFKAYCITPTDLERAAAKITNNPDLTKKLRDLALIYATYDNLLMEKYDDSDNDLSKLAELLKEHDFFKGTNVYIDSFTDYTYAEYMIIERIMQSAENTLITIGTDSPQCTAIHFENLINTSQKLHKTAEKLNIPLKITTLTENKRTKDPALSYLCENLWRFDIDTNYDFYSEQSEKLTLMSCANPYSQAQAAADYIIKNIQSGKRYRDFAVIFRDASKYSGIIDAIFDKYKIPYFYSEKTDLSTKPLIKLIFSALRIKLQGFKKDDVISYLRTGLCGADIKQTDMFEEYVNVWNISGKGFQTDKFTNNPDGYVQRISSRGQKILDGANSTLEIFKAPLLSFFTALENAHNGAEMCEAVYAFTEGLNVPEKLTMAARKDARAGRRKQADESMRLYNIFISAIDELSLILGDDNISCEEFFAALRLVLSQTVIGTIPTCADEVIIGSASMLRTDDIKNVLVLGLCEGEFPQNISDSGVLTDNEKNALSELGLNLSKNNALRSADELYYIYRAMTAPQESLYCSYTRSGTDGRAQNPSIAFLRLKLLFPNITVQNYESIKEDDKLWTLNSSLEQILTNQNTKYAKALEKYCSELGDEKYTSLLVSSKIPVSQSDEKISNSISAMLFGEKINLTQSKIDKYIRCHFNYYCENILALRNTKRAEFKKSNIGTFIHKILELFLSEATDSDGKISNYQKDKVEELISNTINGYIKEICPLSAEQSNRMKHLFIRLRRLSLLLIENLYEEFNQSDFSPTFFELFITDNGKDSMIKPIEIELDDGTKLSISGICDRVDTYKKDNNIYVRVIDYKTGSKTFALSDIKKGLNTQLLLYLIAICKSDSESFRQKLGLDKNSKILPAGVMYLSSNISTITLDNMQKEEDVIKTASDKISRSGLVINDEEILRAMNKELDPKFLADVKTDKSGMLKGKSLMSYEGFEQTFTELDETLCEIAKDIKSGEASAKPMPVSNKYPCEYCEMKNICRSAKE